MVICLQKNITEEQERRLEDALWQEFEIGKEKYQIITGGNGKTAMDTAAASGTSSDSGSNASIQAEPVKLLLYRKIFWIPAVR